MCTIDICYYSLQDWVFMSVHFWGEDPKGSWTLAITDNNHNDREHHVENTKHGDMEDATGKILCFILVNQHR